MLDKIMYKNKEFVDNVWGKKLVFNKNTDELGFYKIDPDGTIRFVYTTAYLAGQKFYLIGQNDKYYFAVDNLAVLKSDVEKSGGYWSNLLSHLCQRLWGVLA